MLLRPSTTLLRPLASMASASATAAARRAPIVTTTTIPRQPKQQPGPSLSRPFHASSRLLIKPGDSLPDTDALMENTPGQRVNLAEEAQKVNNMLIIGVPAAFSPGCSTRHIPGYIAHPRLGEFESVVVVSVNDVFVMKAWGDSLDPSGDVPGIRWLADPTGKFTKMLDMNFDGSAIFGGERSKRYAIVVEQGQVKSVAVEPDNTGLDKSLAENVLGAATA